MEGLGWGPEPGRIRCLWRRDLCRGCGLVLRGAVGSNLGMGWFGAGTLGPGTQCLGELRVEMSWAGECVVVATGT